MWCGCGIHYLGVWLVGGAFVPEGPSKKLAPMHLVCPLLGGLSSFGVSFESEVSL